jgi:hypothetical protein
MSNITEYWIGENVDYSKLWDAYNSGKDGYIQKFHSMKTVPVRIEFDLPHSHDPLFNLEAIYKTLKGLYYDFKSSCITDKNERDKAGPLFVYSIERGSGDWLLYIESTYVIPFIYFLARASLDICHEYYKTKKNIINPKKLKLNMKTLNANSTRRI